MKRTISVFGDSDKTLIRPHTKNKIVRLKSYGFLPTLERETKIHDFVLGNRLSHKTPQRLWFYIFGRDMVENDDRAESFILRYLPSKNVIV